MGREHKAAAAVAAAAGRPAAVQKHKKRARFRDHERALPAGLVARPAIPKSKHKTIYEWAENTDKKKKLEIEVTNNKKPSANFSFVPIGNPELTNLCKELSREQGALVYIVSGTKEKLADLSDHVHRVGYHFRTHIVEQAATIVGGLDSLQLDDNDISCNSRQKPDPIPEDQDEINRQADAAIRDLFPRIPNTDREMIVYHAFQKGAVFNGKPVVGLQEDLTLSRRVQLAVIAHIRHTHTRYDLLLRETSWENARKTVESLCLDILVKWRGDEETGRDQLDEVLREIVIIDDTEDESGSDDEYEDEESAEDEEGFDEVEEVNLDANKEATLPIQQPLPISQPGRLTRAQKKQRKRTSRNSNSEPSVSTRTRSKTKPKERRSATKNARRGFQRYKAWQEALNRQQGRLQDPQITREQVSTGNVQQRNRSPSGMMNNTQTGYHSGNLRPASRDQQYQAIYAIDDTYTPSRPRVSATFLSNASHGVTDGFVRSTEPAQQPPPSQRMVGPLEPSYREQVIMRPRVDNPHRLEHSYNYDSRPIPIRTMHNDRPAQSGLVRMPALEDRPIPSIEQAGDLNRETSPLNSTYGFVRHSQVMYMHGEPERRLLQNSSNIIYVDDLENQSKRRRILTGDPTHFHFPGSEYYVRTASSAVPEQHYLPEQPLRRIVDAGDYNDLSTHDSRFERGRTATTGRGRVIIDDEPRLIRVIRRSPESSQSFKGQHVDEPQAYRRQRSENQPYLETERPILVMRAPVHKNDRRSDQNKAYLNLSHDRAPQQRLAANSSTCLSTLPSHPHSREMNSGLVSYPIISRTRLEHDSCFSSARNESIIVGASSSHRFPKDHLQPENLNMSAYRRDEYRRPPETKVTRMEQQYIPPESYNKAGEFVPVSTAASGSSAPVYFRTLPRREEIIVLE